MGSHSYGLQWPSTMHKPGNARGRHCAVSRRHAGPIKTHGRRADNPSAITSWRRTLVAAALGAVIVTILLFQYQLRHTEAAAAAAMYNLITPTMAATQSPIVWFGLGRPGGFGLLITPDCSAAFLLVPLFLLGMGLVLPVRLALRQVLSALAAATVVLVTGNLLRIGAIAVAMRLAGPDTGYQIGHLVIGSAISVIFISISLVLITSIITGRQITAMRSR
ncbi:MAG TPA: exosortase/archaeosortase family protein [Streptosporangiaceae bacterium]|nr:exosortase/archaeosortase family protein [Streptosporangiaceae bacterium]